MSQKRSVTQGQLGNVEKLWSEAGGNSKLFQKEILDSSALSDLFASVVEQSKREWSEENGVIYFTVTSDGTTGEDWISKLERKTGKPVGTYGKSVLRSDEFRPTKNVTYKIAVLKGEIWSDNKRITSEIRGEANWRKYVVPHPEVACLIRMKFTDEDIEKMGLTWIITMHEPITDSDGDPDVLGANRSDHYCVSAFYGYADCRWYRGRGFAFVLPQVGTSD